MAHVRYTMLSMLLSVSLLVGLVIAQSSYWVANIERQGTVPFGAPYGVSSSYPVFRNVKDYGAVGDGMNDDTEAINNAISFGDRCGGGDYVRGSYCGSSTVTPALVYFPPGTYKVSSPIIMYYFTELVGDALNPPTLVATANFNGIAVLDADVYIPNASGNEWYANQNNFYRQVRNFVIDISGGPLAGTAGIHWQVAQATSLQNIKFVMAPNDTPNNAQQGIFMENGSGGFMSDLIFEGGDICAFFGNQQFTSRNLQFNGCNTAIRINFDWVWTFTDLTITNCVVGIDISVGGFNTQSAGSVVILDSEISAETAGILTVYVPNFSSPRAAGTLVLENVDFTGSQNAAANGGGVVILPGGRVIQSFAQGNAWTTAGEQITPTTTLNGTTCSYSNGTQSSYSAVETTIQRQLAPIPRPSNLLNPDGSYFARTKPQYENVPASGFLSAKSFGLAGDGESDDTANMQNFLTTASNEGLIAYFDHGAYVVTGTINVPTNIRITGELYPMIMATGPDFSNQDAPQPVWRIGTAGEVGAVEISELIFETKGPVPGAIMIEWNLAQNANGAAGLWDVHWRIGGSAGTELQSDTCAKSPDVTTSSSLIESCSGAFLLLHVTSSASIYMENTWGWVADHELDLGNRSQIDIFNGRGFLIESSNGPVWMYSTAAEHSSLYDYQFSGASNAFMGCIQHETAYWQGNPAATVPFPPNTAYSDPTFQNCGSTANCARTWGLRIVDSASIFQYGAGLYNFYDNWDSTCINSEGCQEAMVDVTNSSNIYLWALSTKGASNMVSYNGYNVVPEQGNEAAFCETIALFEVAEL